MPYDDNWWCNSNETNSKYPMVFCMINLEHKSLDYLFFFSAAKSSLSSFSFSKMLQILWLSCWSPSLFKQEMTGTCINWISKLSDLTSSNLSLVDCTECHIIIPSYQNTFLANVLLYIWFQKLHMQHCICICQTLEPPFFFKDVIHMICQIGFGEIYRNILIL